VQQHHTAATAAAVSSQQQRLQAAAAPPGSSIQVVLRHGQMVIKCSWWGRSMEGWSEVGSQQSNT